MWMTIEKRNFQFFETIKNILKSETPALVLEVDIFLD